MKIITISFLLILNTITSLAQINSAKILEIETYDNILPGRINGNIDFTMYLKFHSYSEGSASMYSVKGWYEYDKYKIKIPIVGFYNGDLYLYVINDSLLSDTILNFEYEADGFWNEMDLYTEIKNFKEKFIIKRGKTGFVGTWESNNKTLDLFVNVKSLDVNPTIKYLILNNKHFINLHNYFGYSASNYTVKSLTQDKVLLSYSVSSRAYALGRCGAGLEESLILLNFDQSLSLKSYESHEIESCNNSIGYSVREIENNITEYTIYINDSIKVLLFNKKTFQFTLGHL